MAVPVPLDRVQLVALQVICTAAWHPGPPRMACGRRGHHVPQLDARPGREVSGLDDDAQVTLVHVVVAVEYLGPDSIGDRLRY